MLHSIPDPESEAPEICHSLVDGLGAFLGVVGSDDGALDLW